MSRTEIFLYVVTGNKNPDEVESVVPFRVSDSHIFFGPDQVSFRKEFRDRFFTHGQNDVVPEMDIYVVGVNELPKDPVRKILWIGRIERVMTFWVAHRLLDDPEFESLRDIRTKKDPDVNMSPLHVEPQELVGNLSGYRHRSGLHSKLDRDGIPEWVKDVVDPRDRGMFSISESELMLSDISMSRKVFRRDCCFLCENIFFAQGEGMPITDEFVSMLDERQPGKGADGVALFGYKQARDGSKSVEKFRGKQLHIRWIVADKMLDYLMSNIPK